MSDAAFAECIQSAPDDITTKLVYADWLDDRNRTVEARAVRDLCRVWSGEQVTPYPVDVELLRRAAGKFGQPRQRIDRLEPTELALLAWFKESWLSAGLATGPCDRAACEAAVALAYERAGLNPPHIRVWLDGPWHGAIGAHLLSQVRDQVWSQVWSQVRSQVRSQVSDRVSDRVSDQVRSQVWRCGYGQHDAPWLAFYATFFALGIDCSKLDGLFALSSCGWWWPFKGAVILTERPTDLEMRGGKLVRVRYADGLEVRR